MIDIVCLELYKSYTFYLPSLTYPAISFVGVEGNLTIELAAEAQVLLNGQPVTVKLWEITIVPFTELVCGSIKINDQLVPFSTFRVLNGD